MKKIILSLTLITLLTSCEQYPKYIYSIQDVLPDSLKAKEMQFIIETMKATDFHLTTSDYEDPEDVIRELKWTYEGTYKIPTEGLIIYPSIESMSIFIPYEKLNEQQKKIFVTVKITK